MKKLMLVVLSAVFLNLSTTANADDFRTGKPTGEIDSINWYTFYRPAFGLVSFQFGDACSIPLSCIFQTFVC